MLAYSSLDWGGSMQLQSHYECNPAYCGRRTHGKLPFTQSPKVGETMARILSYENR